MKKTKLYLLLFLLALLVLALAFISGCDKDTSHTPSVLDYFPREPVVLLFKGGFENSGSVTLYHHFSKDLVDVKHINGGMAGLSLYALGDDRIDLVLTSELQNSADFNKSHLSRETFLNYPHLVGPLVLGNKWEEMDYGMVFVYEITNMDFELVTEAGTFSTIEVTHKTNDYVYKMYFAKNLGLIKTNFDDMFIEELISVIYPTQADLDDVLGLLERHFVSIEPSHWD